MRPPTNKQMVFLENLGYEGPEPDDIRIASMAIDMMKDGATSKTASQAVDSANRAAAVIPEKKGLGCFRACLVLTLIALIAVAVLAVAVYIASPEVVREGRQP